MKLLLCLAALCAAAYAQHQAGAKVRITKKVLDEIYRVGKALNKAKVDDFPNTKTKLIKRLNMEIKRNELEDKVGKLMDAEIVEYTEGSGGKFEFKAPNMIRMQSDTGTKLKMKFKTKKGGKVGTISFTLKDTDIKYAMAFNKNDKGMIQFEQKECTLDIGEITVKVKGYGAEKDKKMEKKAKEQIDKFKAIIGGMGCPKIEEYIGMGNARLGSLSCKLPIPIPELKLYFSMCLVSAPTATADYFELAFCGETLPESRLASDRDASYNPAAMSFSGDGKSKMLYLLDNEAMYNKFFEELHTALNPNELPWFDLTGELLTKFKAQAKKIFPDVNGLIGDDTEVETRIKFVDAVKIDMKEGNSLNVKLHMADRHKIKTGGKNFEFEGEGSATLKISLGFKPTAADQIFPRIDFDKTGLKVEKVKITKCELSGADVSESKSRVEMDRLARDHKDEMQSAIDTGLRKLEEFMNQYQNQKVPPKYRLIQFVDFEWVTTDVSAEFSGSVKVHVDKVKALSKEMEAKMAEYF